MSWAPMIVLGTLFWGAPEPLLRAPAEVLAQNAESEGAWRDALALWRQSYHEKPTPEKLAAQVKAALAAGLCVEAAEIQARLVLACPSCAQTFPESCLGKMELTKNTEVQVDGKKWGGAALPAGARALYFPRLGSQSWVCIRPGQIHLVTPPAPPKSQRAQDLALAFEYQAFAFASKNLKCEAAAALERAYQEVPAPGYLYNLAVAEADQPERCPQAIAAYDRYLAVCPECPPAPKAQQELQKLKERCSGNITLTGAALLNDQPFEGSQVRIAGEYRWTLTDKTERWSRSFYLAPGQTRNFSVPATEPVPLPKLAAPPPPSPPWVATAPPSGGPPVASWVLWATSAAALGVGAWFTAETYSAHNDLEAAQSLARGAPSAALATKADDAIARGERARTGAYVSFGGALLAAGAGVLWWLWE